MQLGPGDGFVRVLITGVNNIQDLNFIKSSLITFGYEATSGVSAWRPEGAVFEVPTGASPAILDGTLAHATGFSKTGDWIYFLDGIKNDINKSIIKYYFADAITILCDIMRAVNSTSVELSKIIDDINDIIFDCNSNRAKQTERILQYFKQEQIIIRIPCLVMPNESDYDDSSRLIDNIKTKIKNAFKDFVLVNNDNLDIEVLLLVFPLRNLDKVRELFLEERKV